MNPQYTIKLEKHFKIKYGYYSDSQLFFTEVLYLNKESKPYLNYTEVINSDNTLNQSYRKINSKGEYSLEAFNSFEEALDYKPHII